MKHKKELYSPKIPIPSFDETLAKFRKQRGSKYPLRLLGTGFKKMYMKEEDRDGNFHIIGTSGHGKSKYLEYHIRKDIDMGIETGHGLCLIDPSDRAATFKAILEYCAFKGHKKVCIINPATLYDYGKIATIQPLSKEAPTKSVQSAQDAINFLFGSSLKATPTIQDNLKALFRMLSIQGMTFYESTYFTNYHTGLWKPILESSKGSEGSIIREKFSSLSRWKSEFSTTITKLNIFNEEPGCWMVGADHGIDFVRMIDEGWIILCNLYPTHISPDMSRFLGILLISQIHRAIEILNDEKDFGDKGRKFYLYIDEAARFATPQIEDILTYNRKSGLHLVFAHHYIDQITNVAVKNAITTNTTNKFMFHVEEDTRRLEMIKLLRFDNSQDAVQKYKNLPKRKFIAKIGKEPPIELEAPFIDKLPFKNKQAVIETYIRERLKDPWYFQRNEIEDQIKARVPKVENDTQTIDTPSPIKTATPDSKTAGDPKKAKRRTLFDLQGEADEFIRNNSNSKKDGK